MSMPAVLAALRIVVPASTSTGFPSIVSLILSMAQSSLIDVDRTEFAFLHACPAFDAFLLVDDMDLFAFAADGVHRTVPGTERTSDAFVGDDNILHEGLAHA